MTIRQSKLSHTIYRSLFYSNIIIVLFASILVLTAAVVTEEIANYRFVMLPDSALGLFAVCVLLIGDTFKKRVLIYFGIVIVAVLVTASILWQAPSAASVDHFSLLSRQMRMPLWQSSALVLLCLPWLGRYKKKTAISFTVFSAIKLLTNLVVIVICLSVVMTQATGFYWFSSSTSFATSIHMAIFLALLASASLCLPYVRSCYAPQYLSRGGWLLVSFIALSSISLWFNYAYQLPSAIAKTAAEIAQRMQHTVDQIVDEQGDLMNRMAERISAAEVDLSPAYYETEFKSYLRDFSYIDYLALQNSDGKILHEKAQYPAELSWFNQYLLQQSVISGIPPTSHNKPELTLHYDTDLNHAFFVISLPLNNRLGVKRLVAAVDFFRAMDTAISLLVPTGYLVQLFQPAQQTPIYDSVNSSSGTRLVKSYQISLPENLHWHLKVHTSYNSGTTSYLVATEVIIFAGWLTTLLVMLSQKFYQQSLRHRLHLMASNDKLQHNVAELQQLQLQQQQIMTNSADMICVVNRKGQFVEVSAACQKILGYQQNELLGKTFLDFVHVDDKAFSDKKFQQIINTDSFAENVKNRYLHKDGRVVHLMWVANYVPRLGLVYAIARNVDDIVKAEQQLRLYKRAVDATSSGIVIADLLESEQPVVYVNAAFEKLTGYQAREIIGSNCRILQGAEQDPVATNTIRQAIASKKECNVVLKNYRKDGSLFWNQLFLAPVPNEDNEVTHYIGVQTDVSAQKQYEQELAYNASHDLLTRLPNRALFEDILIHSCHMQLRRQQSLAVLFINLDGFKLINNTMGRGIGDEVLKQISQRIKSCIRLVDTLARFGGDEFVLLLTDSKDVVSVAERILDIIATPLHLNHHEIHLSASIGISVSDTEKTEPEHLVQQADLAMYRAKKLGRNNFQWYSHELENTSEKQLNLRAQLKKAIVNNEFELYYQPQVDAVNGNIVGVEALLRWPHPELGFISPAEFIPLAENTGDIVALSNWVVATASKYNQSLIERGIASVVMAVNISSIQFSRSNFVEHLQQTISQNGLEARWFEIELTESLLFENTEQVILKLQQLRQLGVQISIDDFGTGYSSLNYLKRLPIDKLKIDQSFIKDIVSDKYDAAISKAIIALAHHLDIKVIAEGVENEAQAVLLRKSFCDEYQGFYFGKPMPPKLLEQYLQNYQKNRMFRPMPVDYAKTILLVDDEENILHALMRVLRREGYQILTCTSASRAFEILALNKVQVIVSDQRMPGMNGTEFLSQVKDMYPNTIRMVLSGYTDLRTVTEAINKGAIYKFMTKPWHDDEIKHEIKEAFTQYHKLFGDVEDK
ncbi:MAG: hypothetical protein CML20_08085 [Rheinheimera sp.]|nr:hypothetical protein [Rheinheimera sp.]|tara:strand:- start:14908 stop:18861 length:3954 start_codon:yes stop_codon:yes gene_type:complete